MKRCAVAVLCLAVSVALCAPAAPPKKPRVVVSFLPLYCFTANVAGDRAAVETLLSGAISPHDYQFSPQDMRKLGDADLLVTLGLGFEPWVSRLRGHVNSPIVEAAAGLKEQLIDGACGHDHDNGGHKDHASAGPNPHVWLDPKLATACVSNIAVALTSVDPVHAAFYRSNASVYVERLHALDARIGDALRPFIGTSVLAYHDALPYFTRRYGLTVAAVVQPVAEVNPSLRRIAELRQIVRKKKVKALLVDANVRSTLAERISKEFRLPIVLFDTLETGAPSPDAYEDVMQSNVQALTRALK